MSRRLGLVEEVSEPRGAHIALISFETLVAEWILVGERGNFCPRFRKVFSPPCT